MNIATVLYQSDRLAQLGLTSDVFRGALEMGEVARRTCTENDPAVSRGSLVWGRTTRGLREGLALLGWRAFTTKAQLELVVSPDGKLAIYVSAGDEWTGRSGGTPKTKCRKGAATTAVIEQNHNQLSLFGTPEPIVQEPVDCVTWIFLIHRGVAEVRSELSLPVGQGAGGKVEAWAERIILEPIGLAGPVISDDQGPDIDVDVSRRLKS